MKYNILHKLSVLSAAFCACAVGMAQTPITNPATTPAAPGQPFLAKGSMTITFDTVSQADPNGKVPVGTSDRYTINIRVADSAVFHGSIVRLPTIPGSMWGTNQNGKLSFDVDCDVVNPRNPAQVKNIGKLSGDVPVDAKNVYHFDTGNLAINTFSMGQAIGIASNFSGVAVGKPPADTSLLSKIKKLPINITRSIHGQNVTIVVSDYDVMSFQNHILAAGPIQIYPATNVNGSMLYDYTRNAWHFQGLTLSYSSGGQTHNDTVTGDIRYVKDPNYATTGSPSFGNSEYDFDVRINEPPPSESAAFAQPTGEADFFATDDSIQGVTGTLKYHDSFKDPSHPSDDSVVASTVQIDLAGNRITKVQLCALVKLLILSSVVPMNSD